MKAYIIYKFQDNDKVHEKLDILMSRCNFLELLLLPEMPNTWKHAAAKKIREADCAIFFVGEQAHNSKNVDWELEKFIKENKPIYTLKLNENFILNKVLFKKNSFGNIEKAENKRETYSKSVDFESLVKIINNNLELDVSHEIISRPNMDPNILIEQYKAYLQTSEDVVSRRQTVSNFYITVNATLISILSTIVTILNILGKDYSLFVTVSCCYLMPVLGIILCFNWKRLVYSYGKLNAAKMQVISAIEKNLPFNIYDVEWQIQIDRLGKKRYISFTKIEKLLPILFMVIYCIIILVGVFLMFALL